MRMFFFRCLIVCCAVLWAALSANAQGVFTGHVLDEAGNGLPFVDVWLEEERIGTTTDKKGVFSIVDFPKGEQTVAFSFLGFVTERRKIDLADQPNQPLEIALKVEPDALQEVVVTGTMRPTLRKDSPIAIEVLTRKFLKQTANDNVFAALQNVNGVRPQINCNVCNTGDIHINGLEGPYTMVLLDGMPIVSGLSTVYGLFGIPNALIERIEIVKGPASTLYGSEAVGGLVNIITRNPETAPQFAADVFGSTWGELNVDLGGKFSLGERTSVLTGVNLFDYSNPIDNNGDGFTDLTLQERISVFQKWQFQRTNNRLFTLAGRFFTEDRWGGELDWTDEFRGSDQRYGESIRTNRWEVLGTYQLPFDAPVFFNFSMNHHDQDSYYGDAKFAARQAIGFGQFTWQPSLKNHSFLMGTALRYTFYDDNTPATEVITSAGITNNAADQVVLPGIFVEDEWQFHAQHKVLAGVRYDYDSRHGSIFTPRFAYQWQPKNGWNARLNFGQGFRVVNLFTEDHAALTGARKVRILETLDPERSTHFAASLSKRIYGSNGRSVRLEGSAWYTYFSNQIIPDYDTDPNAIIYANLDGHAVTRGVSVNADVQWGINSLQLGASYLDVEVEEENRTFRPVLTESWSMNWGLSIPVVRYNLTFDYTGSIYGPMRLPLLSEWDPRSEYSPWWSLQDLQLTWAPPSGKWELYGVVRNLLDFTPPANSIARAHDPFDRQVQFGQDGQVLRTPENPTALSFDPSTVFAPNQGRRFVLGVRYRL